MMYEQFLQSRNKEKDKSLSQAEKQQLFEQNQKIYEKVENITETDFLYFVQFALGGDLADQVACNVTKLEDDFVCYHFKSLQGPDIDVRLLTPTQGTTLMPLSERINDLLAFPSKKVFQGQEVEQKFIIDRLNICKDFLCQQRYEEIQKRENVGWNETFRTFLKKSEEEFN